MKEKYHKKISKALADLAIEKISFLGLSEIFQEFIGAEGLKFLETKGFQTYKQAARGYFKIIKG